MPKGSGRKRKTKAELEAAGSRHLHLLGRDNQAEYEVKSLKAPWWLEGEALKTWNTYEPILRGKSVLTVADADSFATYCFFHGQFIEESAQAKQFESGSVERRRIQSSANDAAQFAKSYGACFGLNPADRSKAQPVAPQRKADPKAALLANVVPLRVKEQ